MPSCGSEPSGSSPRGRPGDIAFNDTGAGKPIAFARWAAGERPRLSGRSLAWSRSAAPDASYASFRRYMDVVFTWAGTYSLERELAPKPVAQLAAGDLFIKGGFPGHAVLVADVVENRTTGERRFLLVQSFMPAQEMHVLKNPANADGSPWYPLAFGDRLVTPEWVFPRESLRTWRDAAEAAIGAAVLRRSCRSAQYGSAPDCALQINPSSASCLRSLGGMATMSPAAPRLRSSGASSGSR